MYDFGNIGAEMTIKELESEGGIERARVIAETMGDGFASFIATAQADCLDARLKNDKELARKFESEYTEKFIEQAKWDAREAYIKQTPAEKLEYGKYGSAHERWLRDCYRPEYDKRVREGTLKASLVRFNWLAESKVDTYISYAMQIAPKAVPAEDSPQRKHYIEKLRNLAELSQLSTLCIFRSFVV